ncbi:tetratricopeptide repeat protein [Oceanospirillum maris]|jgi:lipopolysaccharide biosynthesis regulator YciM|uniref:tetratricopeptide repeat protein n=1 Tax=Oceanospirillum maris TaxID=64977 RepID=UPI00041E43BC|nr:tetratricopeptide repeat protein [Oceanospirillum maris]
MNEVLLLLTLVIAIAIGFFLGRRSKKNHNKKTFSTLSESSLNKDYFTGLTYLLNDQQDQAIETFMRVLEINPETVDTHIAMGNLFRSKGEIEKAIRLHQNLFARPSLSKTLTQQVQLELARDFFAAGLFDRAERLLLEITDAVGDDIRLQALTLLIRLYEQEKEWQKAIEVSGNRQLRDKTEQRKAVAHYYCELAEALLSRGETTQARKHLKQALYNDPNCIRANWSTAHLELKNNNSRKGKSLLLRIPVQDKRYYSLVLPELSTIMSYKEISSILDESLDLFPSETALALKVKRIQQQHGNTLALEYLEAYSGRQQTASPYIAGLMVQLMAEQATSNPLKMQLSHLEHQLMRFDARQHKSRCISCGFKSQHSPLWQCPKCRSWGSVRPDDTL